MEEDLDRIAGGETERVAWLTRFYFGDGAAVAPARGPDDLDGLQALVENLGDIDAREINTHPVGDGIVLRVGRYGPYVERARRRRARALRPRGPRARRAHRRPRPRSCSPRRRVTVRWHRPGDRPARSSAKAGRFGPYVTRSLPEGAEAARARSRGPPRCSRTMSARHGDARRGAAAAVAAAHCGRRPATSASEITAQNGRYGPYLKKGTDSRSLETEDQLFTVTLDEALAHVRPAQARGRGAARPRRRCASSGPTR